MESIEIDKLTDLKMLRQILLEQGIFKIESYLTLSEIDSLKS